MFAGLSAFASNSLEERALFQNLGDALFDRVSPRNRVTVTGCFWPMRCAIDGLVLHRRVPPAVEQEHVVGELQVQADAPVP